MRAPAFVALTITLSVSLGACDLVPPPGHGHHDAGVDLAWPGPPLPLVGDLCHDDDPDHVAVTLRVRSEPVCDPALTANATGPYFIDALGDLPADYTDLHALCARMNPAPRTRDDLDDPALGADLDRYLTALIERPPLRRALAALPDDPAVRKAALTELWLTNNALEHVLCGELNFDGGVGGLHLWSEYYLAEREGRADYRCTYDPDDLDEATFSFDWRPAHERDVYRKPLGGFVLGASPACILALGYTAVKNKIPPSQNGPALQAELYGVTRNWVLALREGAIVTLYPVGP